MKNGIIHFGDPIKRDGPVLDPWQAKWIWGEDNKTAHNWLCLRKKVTLAAVPAEAIARIAVDSRYWLWVNGKIVIEDGQIKRGPTLKDTYFEYVDLKPFLREGENTFAVLAWYFGSHYDSFSYCSSGQAAFVMEAQLGDQLLVTDETWKVTKHTAFLNRRDITGEGPSYRIAEEHHHYDARLEKGLENFWMPDYDDAAWENAIVYGNVGDEPWNQLWERSVPQMKSWPRTPYKNPEAFSAYKDTATTEEVSIKMEIPYNMQVQPYLKVEAPAGCEIKMLSDGSEPVNAYYVTRDGVQEFEAWYWISAQSITYVVPAGVKILDLQFRQTGYASEFAGKFNCEDERLNSLWMKSLYTLYITMRDNYMDCPDRERAQWWGDCTNESHMTFYALDPDAYLLYRKGVDTLVNWRYQGAFDYDKYNVLQTVVPSNGRFFELPMQQLAGVNGFWTYYLYTGERDFLEEVYQPAIDYLKRWILGIDGVISHRMGTWDWADWGENFDTPVMENAWYYMACKAVRNIANELGITKDLPFLNRRMDTIAGVFNKYFWAGDCYHCPQEIYDEYGYSYRFPRPEKPDDRANALAVLSGLAEPEKYPAILEILKVQMNSCPYMEKYVLDAMYLMGYEDEAMERMLSRYSEMIESPWTTLWESFVGWGTKNHAWSGGPLISLSGNVAGVAPDKGGYAEYHVIPQLGKLNKVSTLVPSVKGDILVAIDRDLEKGTFKLALTSPKKTVARVAIPKLGGKEMEVTVEGGSAAFHAEDENYLYYLAQPGKYEFIAYVK